MDEPIGSKGSRSKPMLCPNCKQRHMITACTKCGYVDGYPVERKPSRGAHTELETKGGKS